MTGLAMDACRSTECADAAQARRRKRKSRARSLAHLKHAGTACSPLYDTLARALFNNFGMIHPLHH